MDMNTQVGGGGVFSLQCVGADGRVKWEDTIDNLVMNAGLQDSNTKYFTGAAYTAGWYLGLVRGPVVGVSIAAGDTLASHVGWVEETQYSGTRKAATFGTATTANPSVISNSAAPASFAVTAGVATTVAGAFLCSVTSGTAGVLFSAAAFQAPGDRQVISGDTLNVTYTFSYATI